jgi:hypothetical protein
MVNLQIKQVTLLRPFAGGPDVVTVVCSTRSGDTVDFQVEVPLGTGEDYCRKLGASYTRRVETLAAQQPGQKRVRSDLLIDETFVEVK